MKFRGSVALKDSSSMSWNPDGSQSLARQSIRGVKWTLLQASGGQAISLLLFLVLARLLEPRVFGIMAIAAIFVALFDALLDQGLGAAIVQRGELTEEHLDAAFWLQLSLGLLLALLVVFFSSFAATIFGQPDVANVLRVLSIGLWIGALSRVQAAILRRRFEFRSLALRTVGASSIGGLVGIGMAATGFGVWSLVGQQIANRIAEVIILWSVSSWRPSLRLRWGRIKELYSFGVNVTGSNLLAFLNMRSDDFLIGYFLGPVSLGLYAVAYRALRMMIGLFSSTLSPVAFSAFSRLQVHRPRLVKGIYKANRLISFVSFPLFGWLLIFAPDVVRFAFGEKWAPAIPVMQILSLNALLVSVVQLNSQAVLAMGKARLILALDTINTAANLVAFALAVRWGILAVAAAFVARAYLLAPLRLLVMTKEVGISIPRYLHTMLTPLLALLLMGGATLLVDQLIHFEGPLTRLSLLGPFALAFYFGTLMLIDRDLVREGLATFREMAIGREESGGASENS